MSNLSSRASSFLLAVLAMIAAATAQDDGNAEARQEASALRLKRMRELVQQFEAQPLDAAEEIDLSLRDEPILRYNDPARELADGSVWRLGRTGRPHAIVAVELIPQRERYMASYEFLAVETPKFRGKFQSFTWEPPHGFAEFRPIPDGPSPASTVRARLTQMKLLARRFTAYQTLAGENNRLRMLPQPIDRYQSSNNKDSDGAAFAFTYGVNPEIVLLMETDGAEWQFACLRLSVARLFVELDGKVAWNAKGTGSREFQNPLEVYTQSRQYLAIPDTDAE